MPDVAEDPSYRDWREIIEPIAKKFDLAATFENTSACWDKEGSEAMALLLRQVALQADRGVQFHRDVRSEDGA